MKVTKHTKFIWQIEDLIPLEEIDYFMKLWNESEVPLLHESRNYNRNNDSYQLTQEASKNPKYIELDNICWSWIEKAHTYFLMENQWIFYMQPREVHVNSRWMGNNVIRTYDVTDMYQWHTDHIWRRHSELSYLLYLNDDFEGGNTKFFHDKLSVKPKKGSFLCFPVDSYHIHKGSKVTSGHKKVLWNCLYRDHTPIQPAHAWTKSYW